MCVSMLTESGFACVHFKLDFRVCVHYRNYWLHKVKIAKQIKVNV